MLSPDTTKYLIHVHLETEGVVEKPDVVGAIFGQTEGLLGEDLDLRDLQRTGRVGRIDVQLTCRKGETEGEVLISSSLDRAETAILAASLETIDRVGPCLARVQVKSIEDIRVSKRKKIVERAKVLLIDGFEEGSIDTYALLDSVRESIRIERISTIGEDRLPAGPNVIDSDAVIVVEGRADVLTLLKFGIKNAVAVEGTHVSSTIIDLCEKKTASVFLDGDRGGDLILQELLQVAEIDFVAYAPRTKSVEDLTRKEVIKALRNKVPADYVREQILTGGLEEEVLPEVEEAFLEKGKEGREKRDAAPPHGKRGREKAREPSTLSEHIEAVKGTGKARFLSVDLSITSEVPATGVDEELISDLPGDPKTLIIDGRATQKVLDLAVGKGLEYLAAREFFGIVKRPLSVRLLKMT
ncbi:MAG: DNA primase DnaG [Methanomicrobiales archaeon]|nr:DNA primase DnaG [Methanomicrobiales archaeon]